MTIVNLTLEFPETFQESDIEATISDIMNDMPRIGHKSPIVSRTSIFDKIRTWAKVKGILDKGDPKTQGIKLMEEVGELAKAILHDNKPEIKDAIGDIIVVLTSEAHFAGLKIEDCIESAYQVINLRKGNMIEGNFVKDK